MSLKVFLSKRHSLRAALGVFLTNTREERQDMEERGKEGGGDLFAVMIRDVLVSFKCSALRSSSDWSLVIVFSSTICVDFMSVMMMWVACFCTLLTRSKFDLAVVPHLSCHTQALTPPV